MVKRELQRKRAPGRISKRARRRRVTHKRIILRKVKNGDKNLRILKGFFQKDAVFREALHRMDFILTKREPSTLFQNETFNFVIVPKGMKSSSRKEEITFKRKSGVKRENIPKDKGYIYRGMSWQEYQNSLKRGFFQSRGGWNIGETQKNLTIGTKDPERAAFYATSFTPWQKTPTPESPAIIVAFDNQGWFQEPLSGNKDEMAFKGLLPLSSVKGVYQFQIQTWRPGKTWFYVGNGRVEKGSRFSPEIFGNWRKVK